MSNIYVAHEPTSTNTDPHIIDTRTDQIVEDCLTMDEAIGRAAELNEALTENTTTDTLVAVYDRNGQSGVEEWVMANHPEWPHAWCKPCEAITPTYEDVCAVCFTARTDCAGIHNFVDGRCTECGLERIDVRKYTDVQATQMRMDTTITYSGTSSLGQAHIAAAPIAEADPRFFMDREWLAWFADEHPEWKIVGEMVDLYEASNYLYVWMVVLEPVWAEPA